MQISCINFLCHQLDKDIYTAGGGERGLQGKDNQKDFGREDSFGGCSYATGEDNFINNQNHAH